MKTEFKTKFLQHLNQKRKEGGFTLIELLVVIIIIGILAAIALPSFLNQAAKAKQSEGKNTVGAVNRAQQSYRLENTQFAPDFKTLEIGIPTEGNNYTYSILGATVEGATVKAFSTDIKSVRNYIGLTSLVDGQSLSAACGEKDPEGSWPAPSVGATGVDCGTGETLK
jgi:type IV pilus assembly protein PilA